MITWLTGKMAVIGAAVAGVLGLLLMVFSKGKSAARQEIAEETHETVIKVTKDARKVREKVRCDGPDAARERMRQRRLDRNQ